MLARLIFLAPGLPLSVNSTNVAFSAAFKSTMYFFATAGSLLAFGEL